MPALSLNFLSFSSDDYGLSRNSSVFLESLVKRVQGMSVKIRTAYLGKEFFNIYVISKLNELN